uniref:Uncharacterized protein n=1 Tax=Arundo donax TaxID=35708 RepID=A0A0A8YLP3_ARUDO
MYSRAAGHGHGTGPALNLASVHVRDRIVLILIHALVQAHGKKKRKKVMATILC